MSKHPIPPPPIGQSFIDDEGVCWCVRNVIHSPSLAGFFLARLDHGSGDCNQGSVVVAPMEYEALVRSRGLKATAPALMHPVVVQAAKKQPSDGLQISMVEPAQPGGHDAPTVQ